MRAQVAAQEQLELDCAFRTMNVSKPAVDNYHKPNTCQGVLLTSSKASCSIAFIELTPEDIDKEMIWWICLFCTVHVQRHK